VGKAAALHDEERRELQRLRAEAAAALRAREDAEAQAAALQQ
jgi:hypothetical protein